MQQVLSLKRRPSFLQRSPSVSSLVAWKDRYETYFGKFCKKPSFTSYENELTADTKLVTEELSRSEYNKGPENDLPPGYDEVTMWEPPASPPPSERKPSFGQDFTALEIYLKKKLCIRKKSGCRIQDTQLETAKVFEWLHELPHGDNLEEFLEAYGIPTKGVDIDQLKAKLKIFLDEKLADSNESSEIDVGIESKEEPSQDGAKLRFQRQITDLEDLSQDDNLEKWIESLDVPYFKPIPETKNQIKKFLQVQLHLKNDSDTAIPLMPVPQPQVTVPIPSVPSSPEDIFAAATPKWKEMIERMRDLKNEDELDRWLESLEVPNNIPLDKLKMEIKKYFIHETFNNFEGKSYLLQEHTLAKELWEKFEDSSVLKQVAIISGTTAALGLLAVISTTMLSFAFPPAFAANPYFAEVFAQYFMQRQEVAYNLLSFHAQNAKPLSTAWAKQYILWKYC